MAWHRAGTVAVTNGSTTVTGINTAFAANTRVGDAFIGSDGRQYELQNVASDTVISIFPAYIGPTASGQAYAIVPIQGYQKGLGDQVRDWTNQYGGKMAALGTTGNYDILPVGKGGTGGTDQPTARSGLGLGTAATATLGTNPGNAMPVGAFGLGAVSAPVLATAGVVGFSVTAGASADQTPSPGSGGSRITMNTGGLLFNEIVIAANSAERPTLGYRQFNANGVPGPWNIVYTNMNTTRAADGTLKAI